MTIGTRIQKLRKEKGLSQEELAKIILVSRQTISQWETDQTVPSIDNIYRLKEVLDISFDELLSDQSNIIDSEDQPLEEYRFSYQKECFKTLYQLINKETITLLIVLLGTGIAGLLLSIITKLPTILIGLLAFSVVLIFLILLSLSMSIKKTYKNSIIKTAQKEYNYKIYDDHFVISIFDKDDLSGTYIIRKNDIKELWENQEYYIFGRSKQELFIFKKDILKQNSLLPSFFPRVMIQPKAQPQSKIQPKNQIKKQSKWSPWALIISILLIVCSAASIFGAITCVALASANDPFSSNEYMWLFYLFAPIPLASIIFGIYQICKKSKRTENIVAGTINIIVGVIMFPLLCIYGSFTFIFADTYTHDYQVVTQWEEQTGIDFPDTGEISTQDYATAGQTGKYVKYTNSFVKFNDNYSEAFMKQIYWDERWINNLPTNLAGCVPFSISSIYDYCLLYNLDTNEINKMPDQTGNYHFVYFTYNHTNQTLIIEEYSTEIIIE